MRWAVPVPVAPNPSPYHPKALFGKAKRTDYYANSPIVSSGYGQPPTPDRRGRDEEENDQEDEEEVREEEERAGRRQGRSKYSTEDLQKFDFELSELVSQAVFPPYVVHPPEPDTNPTHTSNTHPPCFLFAGPPPGDRARPGRTRARRGQEATQVAASHRHRGSALAWEENAQTR